MCAGVIQTRVVLVSVLKAFMVSNTGFPIELLQVSVYKGGGFISWADRVPVYHWICMKSSSFARVFTLKCHYEIV